MALFHDLPVEILPLILRHLPKPQHLASASLVNATFNVFATSLLYERVTIHSWYREAKIKVLQLFTTLAAYPRLAKLLHRLEVRDFPKAIVRSEIDITDLVVTGLQNCVNLHTCTWTRDGSLSSEILRSLSSLPKLQGFEFNGHSQGQYDPCILRHFKNLSRISVIMPTPPVVLNLSVMLSASGHTLRNLTIICKSSGIVTDDILESLSDSLVNIEQLYLTGCPKVTGRGVGALVSASQPGLTSLGLEGVSSKFDMAAFSRRSVECGSLIRLRSITLTVPHFLPDIQKWTKAVIHLLSSSPLEQFQIYATSTAGLSTTPSRHPLMYSLWSDLITAHGARLVRFSVHRMSIGHSAIHDLCVRCPRLEELFLVIEPRSLDALPASLSQAKRLRTLHINYPLDIHSSGGNTDEEDVDPRPVLSVAEALAFISRCSPSIRQFGCNTRVWQVGRQITRHSDDNIMSELRLLPYESQDIPEQFLVVRT